MTIGAVLDEAWTLYTRFFGRFFLLGLVVFALANLAYALLVEAIANDSAGATAALGILGVATAVIGSRTRQLVLGHSWTVFAIALSTGLLSGIASAILQAAFSFLPRFLENFVGGTIAQAVVASFVAIVLAITYFRLRDAHGEPAEAAVAGT